MIEFENVSKTYEKGTRALKDINLKIGDGEFVFLVGDSGSGKTTMVKLLLRELKATSGKIWVGEQELGSLRDKAIPAYRRRLGVVFQDFRLLKDRTVFDNVAFARQVVGASRREISRDVPQVLAKVGLAAKYLSYPKELSGGEQQRVTIARAIINHPEILIADEPTGNMDPDNAWHIMQLLEEIHREGTTVIVVTHSKELVDRMRKRVVAMKKGVIVRDEEKSGYLHED
ncbi:MAG: cell division ATP-binding protein FtsE [Lachnospiraceae bacterium]|nr:cell division ATP-binding protein FtsE [Lachnospiraceae bacterium]